MRKMNRTPSAAVFMVICCVSLVSGSVWSSVSSFLSLSSGPSKTCFLSSLVVIVSW